MSGSRPARVCIRRGRWTSERFLAKYTGGMRVSFAKLKGLESVVQKIGADLHSQYLLSFQPLSSEALGAAEDSSKVYRELRVRVRGMDANVEVRHRPGYWQVPP